MSNDLYQIIIYVYPYINMYIMIITPIDDQNNLFAVKNVYSDALINKIQKTDFMSLPHEKIKWEKKNGTWQQTARHKIEITDDSILAQLKEEMLTNIPMIAQAINIPLKQSSELIVWIDEAGFDMGIHTDNGRVEIALQVYLTSNTEHPGTTFYGRFRKVRHVFPYVLNTGYLMINNPKQWHNISSPVTSVEPRITNYAYLHYLN